MKRTFIIVLLLGVAIVQGCNRQPDVPPITEWSQFDDQYFRVTFTYPKDWHIQTEPGKVIVTSTQAAMNKFFDPYSKEPAGAQIVVAAERADTVADLTSYVDAYRDDLTASGFQVKDPVTLTLEGNPAIAVEYAGRYDEHTTLTAVRAFTLKDTMVYYVHFAGINQYFPPYRFVYDSLVASIVLPKPRVVQKDVDPSLPVADMDKFANEVLEIAYPSNFSTLIDQPKGEVTFSMRVKGHRDDAIVAIDVRPAKKLTLEKVTEQNSKNFRNVGSTGKVTVSGEPASVLQYSPARGVEGKAYFVVKDDKFYRIIVFYPTAMKKDFQPAFDKAVASLRIK